MESANGCMLCPRHCGAKREYDETGVCGCSSELKVARAALHMWEEPCISGTRGSGAVFFSGCPLHCIFCQNREISDGRAGKSITVGRLGHIFLELQDKGAANINLVTAGQYADKVVEAVKTARRNGLTIPVICNTGGYETEETLKLLGEVCDVWLPDLKYLNAETARGFSHAADYPEVAVKAIDYMVRQAGEVVLGDDGYIRRGVIVRHLVLPGHRKESEEVIGYLYRTYGDSVYLSIMNQYTPPQERLPYPELNRRLTTYEYDKVVDYALSLGVKNAFVQERGTAKESFIPAFDYEGV